MWQFVRQWVADWNVASILVRILIAWVIGFLIGMDREWKNKSAGIRTHVLVCVGTAVATMTATYAHSFYPEANIDITRLGGQMIAGIGFLGAGAILVTNKNRIQGLTTAAGLWACACSGLAIGFGFLEGTIIAVALIIITQVILPSFERFLHRHEKLFDLYLEFRQGVDLGGFLRLLHTEEIEFADYQVIREDTGRDGPIVTVNIHMNRASDQEAFLEKVRGLEDLDYMNMKYS